MNPKSKILLLHTGGTIGMNLDGQPDPHNAFNQQLIKYSPSLFEMADVTTELLLNKDSSNISPGDWVTIARTLDARRKNFDAFIITHGTDTMTYTATALSFMLQGFGKPVLITGAQRPLVDPRSDGPRNLVHAAQIALEDRLKEVSIFFDSYVFRGNRARKVSSLAFEAFSSPNFPALAHVGVKVDYSRYLDVPTCPYKLNTDLDTRVFSFAVFPGLDVRPLAKSLNQYKAVVIQAFGPGDIPSQDNSLVSLIKDLSAQGTHVIISSQSATGEVDLSLYEPGRTAQDAGALSSLDMTWETSVIKAMYLLAQNLSRSEFHRLFHSNLAGELLAPEI